MAEIENKIQRYDSYKDSGVEWLGEIPEHWKVLPIKRIADTKAGGTPTTSNLSYWDGEIPWLPSGKLQNCVINSAEKFITEKGLRNSATKLIKQNTTLIALTGATCANIGYLKFEATANQSVIAIEEFKDSSSKFIYYNLINERKQILLNQTGGAQAGINETDVKNILLTCPPLSEQTKIAQFLDDKTTKIDDAIAIKQQQINLLKERKQILIHKAVTRGLDDNVALKDSGVEWIGEIPEHWEVKRLKHCLNINNGSDYKHIQTDEGYPVIGSGGQFAYASDYMYDGEVVLLGRKGTIDKPLYFKGKFWAVDTMFYANAINGNIVKYLYYLATTLPFSYYSTATALPSMTQGDLNNHPISRPPIDEQNKIVDFIENGTQKIETAIDLKQQEIDKLKEYKSSLINGVVTGKVRVC